MQLNYSARNRRNAYRCRNAVHSCSGSLPLGDIKLRIPVMLPHACVEVACANFAAPPLSETFLFRG